MSLQPQLTACEPVKRVQNWTARKQLKNCNVLTYNICSFASFDYINANE